MTNRKVTEGTAEEKVVKTEKVVKKEKKNLLTKKKIYNFYQEKSGVASDRADELAWMFVIMMTGGLISGHAYTTFSECAAFACLYVLLSVLQALWQTITSWHFMLKEERKRKECELDKDNKKKYTYPEEWPDYIGSGAWVFYYLKMMTITVCVIFFIVKVFF